MKNMNKTIVSQLETLNPYAEDVDSEDTLLFRIAAISKKIVSDPDILAETVHDSKVLFLCKKLKNIMDRKALIEQSDPEDRNERMNNSIEQTRQKAVDTSKEIYSLLVKIFNIEIKAKEKIVEEVKQEEKRKKNPSYAPIRNDQKFHLITIGTMFLFVVVFKFIIAS